MRVHSARLVLSSLFMTIAASVYAQAPVPAAGRLATPVATARTGVQLRVDSVGSTSKTGDAATKNSQSMSVSTARLGVSGDLAEQLSYTLRLNLKSASNFSAERNTPDGGLAALDRAFIEHRIIPGLTLKFGRMPLVSGSIETDYSSIDVYYYSYVNGELAKVTPITTGADLSYSFNGHTISFDAFNGFYDGNVEKKGSQRGENMSYGVGYRSNIGGVVKPIITYNRLSRIRNGEGATRDEKATFTAFAVGVQVAVFGTDIDLEYDQLSKPKFVSYNLDAKTEALLETPNDEKKVSGIIAQVAHAIPDLKLRAFVKASSDKETTDGDQTYKAVRGAVGVEYRPGPKGMRYHAVLVDSHDDAGKTPTRTNARQYIVGVAAKM